MKRSATWAMLAWALAPLAASAVPETGAIAPEDTHFSGYLQAAQRLFDAIEGHAVCGLESAEGEPEKLVAACRLGSADRYCGPVVHSSSLVCFEGPGAGRVVAYEYFGSGLIMHWDFVSADGTRAQSYEEAVIGLFPDQGGQGGPTADATAPRGPMH